MAIHKILCCCGSGLGSSLIVHMNTEEVVKKLGADFVNNIPDDKKIVLKNILDKNELEEKLKAHLG